MSGFPTSIPSSGWQQHFKGTEHSFTSVDDSLLSSSGKPSKSASETGLHATPLLRSYRSTSFLFDSAAQNAATFHEDNRDIGASGESNSNEEMPKDTDLTDQAQVEKVDSELPVPTSPVSGDSHISPKAENDDEQLDAFHELDFDIDENEQVDQPEIKPGMTPAEIRAQKRKMKRFRLTHNQTRFLMSEFARQAHPDAAHRERLAREIPGLSPRQVQVWFQNRRAKLKRLNSDDRERMMSSRALPENFDMTQALHSPFGAVSTSNGTPLPSPAPFSTGYPGQPLSAGPGRHLTLDTGFRRLSENHMSPTGISPAFGAFAFTPPQSATDTISPVSTSAVESSPFSFAHTPPSSFGGSPKRPNPFAVSYNSTSSYTAPPKIPRLNIYDRMGRSRAESLQSPLRTSISYSTLTGDANQRSSEEMTSLRATSVAAFNGQSQNQGTRTMGLSNSSTPYGLGYSYGQIPGFQATAAMRNRSFSSGAPRRIELPQSSLYRPSLQRVHSSPQTATFPSYSSQPLATPPAQSHSANMSAPYNITAFPNSYLRQDDMQSQQHHQHFSPVTKSFGDHTLNGVTVGETQNRNDTSGVGLSHHF
ncbi:MAG: hypothetical protein M1820_005601 [Bogoriella megaspora]|nr:MAG: hypothetical protein M1820_005601 [Bogoriella megaspora]